MPTNESTIEFWGRTFALRYDRQARQWFAVDLDPARNGEAMAVANTRDSCAFYLGLNLARLQILDGTPWHSRQGGTPSGDFHNVKR